MFQCSYKKNKHVQILHERILSTFEKCKSQQHGGVKKQNLYEHCNEHNRQLLYKISNILKIKKNKFFKLFNVFLQETGEIIIMSIKVTNDLNASNKKMP